MTGMLKEVMHEKTRELGNVPHDLDRIIGDGDRRIRRRRYAGVAVGAVSVAATLALTATVLGSGSSTRGLDPANPTTTLPLTYAAGSVVHQGDQAYDVGRTVRAIVQTSSGAVFTDPDRGVWLLRDGLTERAGTLAPDQRGRVLLGEDTGRYVAWIGDDQGDIVLTVLDTVEHISTTSFAPRADGGPPHLEAFAGSTIYLSADHEEAFDIATAQFTTVGSSGYGVVEDAAAGQLLHHLVGGPEGGPAELVVNHQVTDRSGIRLDISSGDLSPDAKHVLTQDADQFAVFDVATGERTDPPYPGFEFAAPYQWLDNDTIAAVALPGTSEQDPVSLLVCHVSTNSCEVAARDIGVYPDVAFPMGEALGED